MIRLKLYGLERTCTNIVRWLVNTNTNARVFHGPGPGHPEWKHGRPIRTDWTGYLLCVKAPLPWMASIARREGSHPERQIARWNAVNRALIEFQGPDTFIVRHEDVIEAPAEVVKGIAETFGATYTLPIETQPNKMHRGGDDYPVEVTQMPFDPHYYIEQLYLQELTQGTVRTVREMVDPWVVRELGYEERV